MFDSFYFYNSPDLDFECKQVFLQYLVDILFCPQVPLLFQAVGVMKPGHCFTIEPMISEGLWGDTTWPDNWTSVTQVSDKQKTGK